MLLSYRMIETSEPFIAASNHPINIPLCIHLILSNDSSNPNPIIITHFRHVKYQFSRHSNMIRNYAAFRGKFSSRSVIPPRDPITISRPIIYSRPKPNPSNNPYGLAGDPSLPQNPNPKVLFLQ